ncbi:hypothetical protein QYE76_005820 [Lolium multiflorum]|uniref:Aminotransferase-like plant mobile domain-containing protein n=1 Tax=Lolium multiflorum TaxID=4521 RepID=A0AAD8RTQ0_LOLMU|nr:hypothetical protein QYE76_005820 [Lolium multiflorum]
MNPSALTALVDRWRPETHTFHLRAGEMAPTLQDVSMILGLPIQGEPRLDEACRRTGSRTGSGGIGGCMLLLSVWSWDRLSVGRPRTLNERPWPHHPNNPDREPTWAYLWDNVSEMTSDPMVMYRQYTAELDTLTAEQLLPYWLGMADLNHKCTEEAWFWRMRCPLICMWLVEHHQPQRVMRQFGLYQECPPQWQDTDKALHRLDRQRQRKITNWPVHHSGHVASFLHCLEATRNAGPEQIVPHDFAAFNNYLEWFHENTRIELVKHAYPEEILDDPIQFDEVGQSQHDTFARRGRSTSIASELNFVREEIQKTAEECEVMWEQSGRDDKPVGPLRYFIKDTYAAGMAGFRPSPPVYDAVMYEGISPALRRGPLFFSNPGMPPLNEPEARATEAVASRGGVNLDQDDQNDGTQDVDEEDEPTYVDEEEAPEPTEASSKGKKKRKKNSPPAEPRIKWTGKKEEGLAEAWKTVSMNNITDANQNYETYWQRVKVAFDERKLVDPYFNKTVMVRCDKAMDTQAACSKWHGV